MIARRHQNPPTLRIALGLALPALLLACDASPPKPAADEGPFDHDASFVVAGSHGTLECVDCHDRNGSSFRTARVDCLPCHGEVDVTPRHVGIAGYAWVNAECIGCHRMGTTTFDHTAFPTAAGTPHAGISCSECHGATSAPADLDCTGCHTGSHARTSTDAAHAGVAGYTFTSPACYDCHRRGDVALPADHDSDLFPVTGSPSHGNLLCSECHGATRQVADLRCAGCHTQSESASQHTRIPATTRGERDGITHVNYQWSSAYCVRCHAQGQVQRIASHPSFDGGLDREGHRPFCLTCHQVARASGKTWATDFSQWSCLACHGSNNPD